MTKPVAKIPYDLTRGVWYGRVLGGTFTAYANTEGLIRVVKIDPITRKETRLPAWLTPLQFRQCYCRHHDLARQRELRGALGEGAI